MAITKQIVLNKLSINIQTPHIEIVKRVSIIEDGVEVNRTHTEIIYTFKDEEQLFASESQFIQNIWTDVSASFIATSGNIE